MLPMVALRLQLGAPLAANRRRSPEHRPNKIALAIAPFTVTEDLIAASLTRKRRWSGSHFRRNGSTARWC